MHFPTFKYRPVSPLQLLRSFAALFILAIASSAACAQDMQLVDSLTKIIERSPADTAKVKLLIQLGRELRLTDAEKALSYAGEALELSQKLNYKKGTAGAYTVIGSTHYNHGDQPKALENHMKALRIREDLKDSAGIGSSLNSIGVVFFEMKQNDKALPYYERALSIRTAIRDKRGTADVYNNIANVYYHIQGTENFKKALGYQEKSLQLQREIGNKVGEASALSNIGNVYAAIGTYDKAAAYQEQALNIQRDIQDHRGMTITLNNLGFLYDTLGNFSKAVHYLEEGVKIARTYGYRGVLLESYGYLKNCYARMHNFENAFRAFSMYASLKDSLVSSESQKAIHEINTQYETEKKDKAIQLLNKDKTIKEESIKRQQLIIYSFIIGLLLLIALAFFIYRGYKQKKAANSMLETAYRMLEEKNKDITDSINYAKRIQTAILPSVDVIREYLPHSFVLYSPKDIVSGDFYWYARRGDKAFIAAGDCTGHGVPGAFMSMIGNDLLNHIIIEKGIMSPGEVLDHLHEGVRAALKQNNTDNSTRDGMDIALLCISASASEVEYAGANRPLWIVKKKSEAELIEIKPDKHSIGGVQSEDKRVFTSHKISASAGDTFYLFSDGYADQFGGEDGKKFMTKRMKSLLLSLNALPMHEQHTMLHQTIEQWRGHRTQVDDILVIGTRV